ncbi:MAG: STAS domain-containing protein [Myxococcales bacterium]|nr:STAS domain-containing protein [Myxococcales bacterium]
MADDSISTLIWSGNLDISQASSVHDELMSALDLRLPIQLDANGVNRIDTSIAQLLSAFFKEAREQDIEVSWKSTSDSLKNIARVLDLESELELVEGSPGAEES